MVTQIFDAALQSTDLKATQFTVLATIEDTGGLPLTKLAEALVMERTTLTRNLNPLIAKQLIVIEQAADQRVRMVKLTDAGGKALVEALPHWEKVQSNVVDKLSGAKWSELISNLQSTVTLVQAR